MPLAGYLGYTSGLSLTCMLFFLISVSLREKDLKSRESGKLGHSLPCNLASHPSYPRSSIRSSSLAVLWTAMRQQWRARAPQAFPSRGSTEAVRLRCSQLIHRWMCRPIGFVPHFRPSGPVTWCTLLRVEPCIGHWGLPSV